MSYNKIGFHTSGAGGNAQGIGDYVRRLDAAGIPAVIVCADGDVGIADALACLEAGSAVPHVLAHRVVRDGTERFALPDYNLSPAQAAVAYQALVRPYIHPTVAAHRDRVWVILGNEPDKNRADWLGEWAYESAELWNADGYKVAFFGFASGEPEPDHWQAPGMLDFLDLAGTRPEQIAVALHEYSYDETDIMAGTPYLVGRFQALFDACDAHLIPRPAVLITEWGWTYQRVPDVDQARAEVEWAAGIYAAHPQILGAALWYLGPGFGGIANQAQRLIAPITDLTLAKTWPEPPTAIHPPDPEVPRPEPPPAPYPTPEYVVTAHLLPQDATLAESTGVLQQQAHPQKTTLLYSADDAARLVAPGRPGSKVVVWGPERWADDIVAWLQARGVALVETQPLPAGEPEPEPDPDPEPPAAQPAGPVIGIDVSHWNG